MYFMCNTVHVSPVFLQSSQNKTLRYLTLKVLVSTIDAQWEGMGDVGSARYEPALLPPCPTKIRLYITGKCSPITSSTIGYWPVSISLLIDIWYWGIVDLPDQTIDLVQLDPTSLPVTYFVIDFDKFCGQFTQCIWDGSLKKQACLLNPKVDTPLFATTANPLQLYHSPRVKIFALKRFLLTHWARAWGAWGAGMVCSL